MAYCLVMPGLALIQHQPPDWHFFSASQRTSICFGSRQRG